MVRKVGRFLGQVLVGLVVGLGLFGITVQPAWAITVTSPITGTNGVIAFDGAVTLSNNTSGSAASLSATLGVATGGTGNTVATDDALLVGNGTTLDLKALTTCTGAGKAVTYNAATNAFGCNTITAGANPVIGFTSETKIAAGSTTVYMGVGGRLSTTEADVVTPVDAHTLSTLRCVATGTTGGSGIAVTLGVGDCTGLTYTSTPTVTVTSTTQQAYTTPNTAAPTAGQCIALKLVPSSTTLATFVNCAAGVSA